MTDKNKTKKHSKKLFLLPILIAVLFFWFFINMPKASAECVQPMCQHFEAEAGQISTPMRVINDGSLGVSGYIQTSELLGGCDQSYPSGSAVFNINVLESGFYKMRARALALWDNNDSFYFKIDDLPTDAANRGYIWDLYNIDLPHGSPYNPTPADWRIQDIRARDSDDNSSEYFSVGYPYEFYLSSGTHQITFYGREYTDIQKYTDPNYRCSSATGELTAKLDWFELVKIDEAEQNAKKWEPYEIRLISDQDYANAYSQDVDVTATFTQVITKQQITVKGFWNGKNFDGKDRFIVRFTPIEEGTWNYVVKINTSLVKSGSLNATAANPEDHGFLRVDKDNPASFVWDDGTRYLMLGTTAYNVMDNVLDEFNREDWKGAIDNFHSHGINKVRFLLSPFPMPAVGGNRYKDHVPFETNVADLMHPDRDELLIGYWQQLDELIEYMAAKNIVADIILFGNYERFYGTDNQDDRYVRYAINRFAAYPNVIWDLANEWDYRMMINGTTEWAKDGAQKISRSRWNHIGNLVLNNDPYSLSNDEKKRPLSIHELGGLNISGQPTPGIFDFFDSTWASYAIIQLWGDQKNCDALKHLAPYTLNLQNDIFNTRCKPEEWGNFGIYPNYANEYNKGHVMPVVNDEYGYLADNFARAGNRKALWGIYVAGGYASMGDSHTKDGGSFFCSGETDQALRWNKNMRTGNYFEGDSSDYPNYKTGCGTNMNEVYGDAKRLIDFFTTKGIEYWKMSTNNEIIGANTADNFAKTHAYVLANPGMDYVVYDADGGEFTVNLEPGKTYEVTKFSPRSDESSETTLDSVSGGSQTFNSNDTKDWVYRLKANNTLAPADVNGDGRVNIKDIQEVIRCIINSQACAFPGRSNVNNDERINIKDIQAIIRKIINP